MAKNKVEVIFAADSTSLEIAMKRLQGETDKTGSKFAGLGRAAKVAATAFLGGLAVAAKVGFDEFKQGQLVAAQTQAVLKSTGGVANVTAADIDKLANSLMMKSGVDDEVIKSGQNMLLTFTNIRNEVGAGNNIFDQATRTALDMSVALGQDMKNSSIQLGKALNNPVKGITALQRVGVTFTQGQRDAIKAMVDAGNTAGAQKIILQELQKEFGGSAAAAGKTLPGQLNVLKQTFSNLAGEMVGAVMPAFQSLAGIAQTVVSWMSQHETTTKVLITALTALSVITLTVNKAIQAGTAIMVASRAVMAIFVTTTNAQTAATTGATVAQQGLNTAMRANVIGIVITALAALAVGLIAAWNKSETFRDIVKGAFNVVKTAAEVLKTTIENIADGVQNVLNSKAVKIIGSIFTTQFAIAKTAVEGVITVVRTLYGALQTALGLLDNLFSRGKTLSSGEFIDGIRAAGRAAQGRKAGGGLVKSATSLVVGEQGPELILPLSRPDRASSLMSQHGVGGTTINMNGVVVREEADIDRIVAAVSRRLSLRVA